MLSVSPSTRRETRDAGSRVAGELLAALEGVEEAVNDPHGARALVISPEAYAEACAELDVPEGTRLSVAQVHEAAERQVQRLVREHGAVGAVSRLFGGRGIA